MSETSDNFLKFLTHVVADFMEGKVAIDIATGLGGTKRVSVVRKRK